MHPKTNLMSIILVLCILAFVAGPSICVAAEEMPVIGKATINKDVRLIGLVIINMNMVPIGLVSFEEQTLYIFTTMEPEEGIHAGGYIADGDGFVHNCPEHGREPMDPGTMVFIPNEAIEAGTISVTIF